MRLSRLRAFAAGVTAGAVAFIGAAGYVTLSDGFGAGDLAAFTVWCGSLSLFVTALAVLIARMKLPARRFARIGIAIACGVVGGFLFTLAAALGLGPSIHAFSFPVLYLWTGGAAAGLAVAAWPGPSGEVGSKRSLWRPLVATASILVAIILLPWALLLGGIFVWSRAEPEVHLLPVGFRGPVVIVYAQPTGSTPEREGGARLYRIPASGVLRTQLSPNVGWRRPEYFYVAADGSRVPIPWDCASSLPADSVQICPMGRLYLSERTGPDYLAYAVTTLKDQRADYTRGDSLVRAVVFADTIAPAP